MRICIIVTFKINHSFTIGQVTKRGQNEGINHVITTTIKRGRGVLKGREGELVKIVINYSDIRQASGKKIQVS